MSKLDRKIYPNFVTRYVIPTSINAEKALWASLVSEYSLDSSSLVMIQA
jgi:hypothetical protein